MLYTVIDVVRIDDEKGKRVSFDFGSEKDCILHSQTFMLDDVEKALKSTTIWTKNLVPDVVVPNVKGLVAFKKISEEEAQEQVLEKHLSMLEGLKGKEVNIFTETNYVNGQRYTNWTPYEPTAPSTTKVSKDEPVITAEADDIAKQGF